MNPTNSITQDTFESIVRENMDEFEMEESEAITDTVSQFEAQHVDLSNIVRALTLTAAGDAIHPALMVLNHLKTSLESGSMLNLTNELDILKSQCTQDPACRSLMISNGAYRLLYTLMEKFVNAADVLADLLNVLCLITVENRDIFDEDGRKFLSLLVSNNDRVYSGKVLLAAVSVIKESCTCSEVNRQSFVLLGLIPNLVKSLTSHHSDLNVIRRVCAAIRMLTVDDDMRAEFGNAHENAKTVAEECGGLNTMVDLIQEHSSDLAAVAELCLTLSRLLVRNEYCQQFVDNGGLTLILDHLKNFIENKSLVMQILALLKTLAGNDDVKKAIVEGAGIELIITSMNINATNRQLCENGCSALGAVSLRSPMNAERIANSEGVAALRNAMNLHPDCTRVQRQACMTVRNMVSRCKGLSAVFLEAGFETLIRLVRQKHPSCDDEAKAALRDLECRVDLNEMWRGEHGEIQR